MEELVWVEQGGVWHTHFNGWSLKVYQFAGWNAKVSKEKTVRLTHELASMEEAQVECLRLCKEQ